MICIALIVITQICEFNYPVSSNVASKGGRVW